VKKRALGQVGGERGGKSPAEKVGDNLQKEKIGGRSKRIGRSKKGLKIAKI